MAKKSTEPTKPATGAELTEALAALKEAENLPAGKEREDALAKARENVFTLQQGIPTASVDANGLAAASRNHAAILKEQRLEKLARQHPEVRELLAEIARLKAKAK
jgi:hypothetical protein